MNNLAEAAPRGWPLLAFLREELAPWDGRLAASARIALCCTLVVALAMLFRIPEAAYAAYLVFMCSQRERTSTLFTGVIAAVVATFALGFSLFLYSFDASEPALRIPLMAGMTFVGMYLSRVVAAGPAAFLAGFLVVITQTLIDAIPNLEALVRIVLWLWVVVLLPVAVTVLVDCAFGRSPAALARAEALKLLDELTRTLHRGAKFDAARMCSRVTELAELRKRAALLDHDLRGKAATDAELIETLGELLTLAAQLPARLTPELRFELAQACATCRNAFESDMKANVEAWLPKPARLAALDVHERPVVVAVAGALRRFGSGLDRRCAAQNPPAPTPPVAESPVAAALRNRDHALFALKTTIAAMAAFVIYNALDWPGIRTAVVTCFFVALTTVGETLHKLTLRLTGAILGGLLGGACVVFVLPSMTDIGQLCLLVGAVSLGCAWVATSSPRLSYAGAQLAFAFFLTVLQGYAPTDDLAVPRDRVVGILLGNALMSLVFSLAWPVGARAQVRAALAQAGRALARLLRELPSPVGRRMAVMESLGKAGQLLSISAFEPGVVADSAGARFEEQVLAELENIAAASFVVAGQVGTADDPRAPNQENASWLEAYADAVADQRPPPPVPAFADTHGNPHGEMPGQALLLQALSRSQAHAL